MRKHLYNVVVLTMLLSLSFILYGCSSSSGSCNLSLGSSIVQPEGPPEPRDPVASNIVIHVSYRDFEPIVGVLVTSDYPGLIPPGTRTDADGNIPIMPINLPEGTEITFNFEKDGHVINSVTIIIGGSDGVKQPDGSILYEAEAIGFIPFTPDSTVKASSLYYPAFMYSWCNGIVASPDGQYLYMAYDGSHRKIVRVELKSTDGKIPQTRTLKTFTGTTTIPYSLEISPDGKTLYASSGRLLISLDVSNVPETGEITYDEIAGNTTATGSVDGTGTLASFDTIKGMAMSPSDANILYISDVTCIRRVNISTKAVDTIAGSLIDPDYVEGSGTIARFNNLSGLALTENGETLYAIDNSSVAAEKKIRKITLGITATTTTVSTICPTYTNWQFPALTNGYSADLALSEDEKTLYVAGANSRKIRAVDLTTETVTDFVGSGTQAYLDASGLDANIRGAYGLTFGSDYKTLYFIDECPHRLRAVDMNTKEVTTLMGGRCGNRDGDVMPLLPPQNIAISKDKNTIYFTVNDNYRAEYYIARFKQNTTEFKRIAGDGTYVAANNFADDTDGLKAKFKKPTGIALSKNEDVLYVADTRNHRIRTVNTITFEVGTFMGNGTDAINDANKTFGFITAMTISKDGRYLFTAEDNTESPESRTAADVTTATKSVIRMIDINAGTITTIAGGGTRAHLDGNKTTSQLLSVIAMDVSPDNKYLYFTEVENINTIPTGSTTYVYPNATDKRYVRSLSLTTEDTNGIYYVKTIAGNAANMFRNPTGIATSADGGFLIVADLYAIKTVVINNGNVKLIAGNETDCDYKDEVGLDARFGNLGNGIRIGLFDLKLSPDGSTIFISDNGNAMIRRIVAVDAP